MPTIDDALALAQQGWRILPLNGKIPRTAHGVKDATADPAHVARWWAGGASWNIGARVPGHLVVLDLDPRNGGTLALLEQANGGPLPDTLTALSGRGDGGRHLYFRHPGGRLTARGLPAGIDVKTETGYCVLPPSIHPETGHPYVWASMSPPAALPTPLLTLVRLPEPKPTPARFATARGEGGDAEARLRRRAGHLAEHVAAAAEGQRNARLYWAACTAHREGYPPDTFDMLERAAVHAGLSEHEARGTVLSAHRMMRGSS
ncbi:bifunctional DNA primase/polymerase [Leucobacter sp. gxy201]|uniref:bifunctional DNA primase/polymerase n=1 Tax=Leucobacter sp. gxy201 TaxID=2957200 RepID=UPI003DA1465C